MKDSKRSPLLIMFFTICIDLIGFGVIIPLSPYLARYFDASGLQIGLLMFTYSVFQLCFSPVWGYLSDRFGRRPIILISLFGSAVAHFYMAIAFELWMLFVARALAGLFGASISVATAYIADVTGTSDRSKNMGIIGAAFGLGFVMGPAISGGLSYISVILEIPHPFGIAFPALGAAFICFANFIFAYFHLPESLTHIVNLKEKNSHHLLHRKDDHSHTLKDKHPLKRIWVYTKHPILGKLLIAEMLLTIGMGQLEATFALFLKEVFSWSMIQASFVFVYSGLIMALTQGFFIRKLMPRFGEKKLLFLGIVMTLLSMLGISLSYFMWIHQWGIYAIGFFWSSTDCFILRKWFFIHLLF